MIKFFRRIRQRLLSESRFRKYLVYAIGEIVLVVIGILIALQINNWNNDRIANNDLNGLLNSIAGGVQTDIRNLDLLLNARESMGIKADSIFSAYILKDVDQIPVEEAFYITGAFKDVLNYINFRPDLNAFEALNKSTYIGKIQGTDLALLLSAYYTAADNIKRMEDGYNEYLENLRKEWDNKFRDKNMVFWDPLLGADGTMLKSSAFFNILRDNATRTIFSGASSEKYAIRYYDEQSLMATKLVEMIKNNQTEFDEQTKLDFSGILYSFGDADYLSILINGETPSGFELRFAASGPWEQHFALQDDYLEIAYPENQYDWGALYFYVSALYGRVNEMDFSAYSKVRIEMRGVKGDEVFELAIKDKNDPSDGTESRMEVELTKEWQLYEFELSNFPTADLEAINVPLSFVFQGPVGRKIHVRSVQFK
jgi:hypothetical protein